MKSVRVFLYRVRCGKESTFPDSFYNIFKFENIESNVIPMSDAYDTVMILEKPNDGALNGRLIKLRNDAPQTINLIRKIEQEIPLNATEKEYIEEITNFVWFYNDDFIFGEYNHFAFKIFHRTMSTYVRNKMTLTENEFSIEPVSIGDILQVARQAHSIYRFNIQIPKENLKDLDKKNIISVGKELMELSSDAKASISIEISKPPRKRKADSFLDKEKAIDILNELNPVKNPDHLNKLVIETEEGTFDMIRGVLRSIKLEVEDKHKRTVRSAFYRSIREYYKAHRQDFR